MAEYQGITKLTIIFPPGDQITTVLIEKEKDTKIDELLNRLCSLRGIEIGKLKKLKILNDLGNKVDLGQTVGDSQLAFIEIVDKTTEKEKKKIEKEQTVQYRERPTGLNIVPGQNCYIPLEEQLFEDERIALKAAKQFSVSKNFSDEYIMASLFARKLDLKRTEEFLNNSLAWRKQRGFLKLPKLSEIDIRLFDFSYYYPGSRDKLGRSIRYLRLNRVTPNVGPFIPAEMTKWAVWLHYVGIYSEGMDGLRNGVNVIAQFDGFGWKNFDVDFQRQTAPLWADTFPLLVRKMLMLNPPAIISAILKISSMFVKEKLMDRVENADSNITKTIDPEFLVKEFGGSVEWGPENYVALIKEWAEKNEERLISPGQDAQ